MSVELTAILETGDIGTVPNRSKLQGIINSQEVIGTTTTTWNPRSGGTSKLIVRGTQPVIYEIAVECQALGYEYNISGGALWTIEIILPVDMVVNDINNEPPPISFWELNYHQVDRNLLELNDKNFITALDPSTIQNIELKINTKNQGQNLLGRNDSYANTVNAILAYNLKLVGVEGKAQFVPTLKRNAIISNQFDLSTESSWDTKQYDTTIMSTEDLLRLYNNDTNALSKMPTFIERHLPVSIKSYDVYDDAGGDLPNPGAIANRLGFVTSKKGIVTFIGWLQFPVEVQQVAINKVQVSQTWVFNQWSAGRFGVYDVYIGGILSDGPDPTDIILAPSFA